MADLVELFKNTDTPSMANFNEKIQGFNELFAAGAKIQTGSYVGTGTYGASNPCSLTFDFEPWLVCMYITKLVANLYSSVPFVVIQFGITQTVYERGITDNFQVNFSYNGNTVSWYNAQTPSYQWNNLSDQVYYLAIG